MTLYEILGVSEQSTAADIKAAHRQAVKAHHPDAGGDAEAFEQVQRAYTVLSDPKSRARYDKTGIEDEASTATEDQLAHSAIAGFIVQFIGSHDDLDQTDIVATIRSIFLRQKTMHAENCRQIDVRIRRVEIIRSRLHRKDDTGGELVALLLERERELSGARAKEQAQIGVVDRALDILKDYTYRLDLTPADEAKIWSALKP